MASGQSVIRFHPNTCTEALTQSMVYCELVGALCEEAVACVLGSIPQFLKDLRKTGLHYWSQSTLRLSQAVCKKLGNQGLVYELIKTVREEVTIYFKSLS